METVAGQLGYTLASYVHPESGLPTDCVYGDNCFTMNQVHIHPIQAYGWGIMSSSGAVP